MGENDEASIAKKEIIENYPESRYAAILSNPEDVSLKDENSPTSLYENTYALHEAQKYEEVIAKCNDYINMFDGDPIVPKFELLKATASGRLKGLEAYKKGINYLALTYANTPEGKKAQEIEKYVIPKIPGKEFVNDSISRNFKVVYEFENSEDEKILDFKNKLDSIIKDIKYYKLNTSFDVYNENK